MLQHIVVIVISMLLPRFYSRIVGLGVRIATFFTLFVVVASFCKMLPKGEHHFGPLYSTTYNIMDNNSNGSTESKQNAGDDQSDYLQQFMKPTYVLIGSCIPLVLGAYAGYRSELRRAASSSASSASTDAYSPGFTSSGGGLLSRVIGDELMDANPSSKSKNMKSATSKIAEQVHVPHVDVGRVAFKALGVGSLLSVGGFCLLSYGMFKHGFKEDRFVTFTNSSQLSRP